MNFKRGCTDRTPEEHPMNGTATPRAKARPSLSHRLRETIAGRRLSGREVARLAGVDPGLVCRFISGKRTLRLDTADRIAEALGLRLVETAPARRRRPASTPAAPRRRQPPRPRADIERPAGLENMALPAIGEPLTS
jgi:transcriptional regulator with XRE-family HTH domain